MRDIQALIADSPVPALEDPALEVAEQLIFALHEGVDWQVWGGSRRARYWDALADRVRAGTYAGPTLSHWWESACYHLSSTPRDNDHRAFVSKLLFTSGVNQRAVLKALRDQASVLVLRVRVHIDAARNKEDSND